MSNGKPPGPDWLGDPDLWKPSEGPPPGIFYDPEYARLEREIPSQVNCGYVRATGEKLEWFPSGVHDYRRVRLNSLLPELGTIDLSVYYRIPRIPCCATIFAGRGDTLLDCERCGNRGYVCPTCLGYEHRILPKHGATYTVACPSCCKGVDQLGDEGTYSYDKELLAVQTFLRLHFPNGVAEANRLGDKPLIGA